MKVIKRTGIEALFNDAKITSAISRANNSVDEQDRMSDAQINSVTANVIRRCSKLNRAINVEEIQDMVEEEIMKVGNFKVSKAYITYRYDRALKRDAYNKLKDTIKEKVFAKNVQNQNANVDEKSFGGRMGESNSAIMKQFALEECMSKLSRENHLNNEIYIHDLDSYAVGSHNCLTIPFDDLLHNGFTTRQTDIRPAGSVGTAFQLVAVIFQLQSLQQFGRINTAC